MSDAPRLFPFLRGQRATGSAGWIAGQFRKAAPFAVASAADLALLDLPVLLVSALVSGRVAVAQWGLTRVVAGLIRVLSSRRRFPWPPSSVTISPLRPTAAAESLRSRLPVVLLASVVSGPLLFWPDFFVLWTHGNIPFDRPLTFVLLIGTALGALESNRGLRVQYCCAPRRCNYPTALPFLAGDSAIIRISSRTPAAISRVCRFLCLRKSHPNISVR